MDIYDLKTWVIALSILLLSLLDGVMTWVQVSHGRVREANPLMHAMIEMGGVYGFYGMKAAMTAIPLAVIFVHKEWRIAQLAARLCLYTYVALALYHIYLMTF